MIVAVWRLSGEEQIVIIGHGTTTATHPSLHHDRPLLTLTSFILYPIHPNRNTMNQFVQRVANYIANVSPPEVSRSFLVPSMHRCDTPLCSLTISFRRCTSFKQEIFIKGLANSKTFQKFAVHTDRHITKIKKEGMETLNTHVDELHKQATKAAFSTSSNSSGGTSSKGSTLMPPTKPLSGISGFFSALGKVIRRDLGIEGGGKKG